MLYFVGINATGMFKYLTQHCYKHVVVMHVLYPKKHAYLSPQFLHIMCGVFFPLLEYLKYCYDTPKTNLGNLFSIYLFVVLFAKFLISHKGILEIRFCASNSEMKLSPIQHMWKQRHTSFPNKSFWSIQIPIQYPFLST